MFFLFLFPDEGKTDLSVKPQSITIFRKKNKWKRLIAADEENGPSRTFPEFIRLQISTIQTFSVVISTKPSQNLLVPYLQRQFTTNGTHA
jgi:hypothetical protein